MLVLSLTGGALVGAFPRAASVPESVVRTVAVGSASLIGTTVVPGLALEPGGTIRADARARTARTRICSPIWFTAVAFTWRQEAGHDVTLHVAAGSKPTDFGPAKSVDEEGGPDPGSPEYRSAEQGSSLLWTGLARCVQLRMSLRFGTELSDVRAVLINSSGTAAGPGTGPPDVGPVAVGGPAAPFAMQPAGAMTVQPTLITRQEWGADPSLMNCTPGVAPAVKMAFVHHTAGTNDYSLDQADDIVRAIYAYHTNGRGWCDIAYNFLIDRFGDVFEGRSGGITVPVISAATQGFNVGSFSVSVMGDFDQVRPPLPALTGLEHVLAWRLDVAHIPPRGRASMTSAGGDNTRYSAGTVVMLSDISGHRDTGYTDCPGARLYRLLPRIRAAVNGRGLPKIYRPTISAASLQLGVPQDIVIRARGSEALEWQVTVVDPAGSAIASFPSRSGGTLNLTWPAAGGPPQPTLPGIYKVVIAGRTEGGRVAFPASLPLTVGLPPSLSPTSSPTPTPTTPAPTTTPT